MAALGIGIIGDCDPQKLSHPETAHALAHAADHLSIEVIVDWIGTGDLSDGRPQHLLGGYDGLFASPGFFEHPEGGLHGIRYARESGKPFVAT